MCITFAGLAYVWFELYSVHDVCKYFFAFVGRGYETQLRVIKNNWSLSVLESTSEKTPVNCGTIWNEKGQHWQIFDIIKC